MRLDRSPGTRVGIALAVGLSLLATVPTVALAHGGHRAHESSWGAGLHVVLFLLGGALVVTGLALDRSRDVPRQYVDGLVLGGAALVLVVAPLLWFV